MRVPKRKSEQLKKRSEETVIHLTTLGIQHLKDELKKLEKQKPEAIEDVSRLAQLGDFSENAEYQEAKFRLRRLHARIFSINDQLKRVMVINNEITNTVQLGSTVALLVDGKSKTYQIVGPQETNPKYGRISHLSPLGSALLNHSVEEEVTIPSGEKTVTYKIIEIK